MSHSQPIHVAGAVLGGQRHLCGLFDGRDAEREVMIPFVQEGLERNELALHVVDPAERADYVRQLEDNGVAVGALERAGQFEMRSRSDLFGGPGEFDRGPGLARFSDVLRQRKGRFPLVRVVVHVDPGALQETEWNDWAAYEARLNGMLPDDADPFVCVYDLSICSGAALIDVLRTHPVVILDGAMRANPFYVPAEEFLARLRGHEGRSPAFSAAPTGEREWMQPAGQKRRVDPREQTLAVVGHDLRAPLGAIVMGASSLARHVELSAESARLAQRILVSARRMDTIIDELLDFANVRLGGGLRLQPTSLDAHELCGRIVEEMRSAYPGREIRLSTEGNARGVWDAHRLERLVSNLLSNALQHGPDDAPVTIDSRGNDLTWMMSVHNPGPAIHPEALPHVFEAFSRGKEAPNEAADRGHLGIGLFIVREIVAAHGGSVDLFSEPAQGTRVVVRLPRHRQLR
jgi:signal transduction histidine kinase